MTGAPGWQHGLLYVFGYQAFKDLINAEPWAILWLTAVVVLIVCSARRNGIHTWFDADGMRIQDFRPDRQHYPFWRYFVSMEREARLREFVTERRHDPKLGEISCAFGEDAPAAYAGSRVRWTLFDWWSSRRYFTKCLDKRISKVVTSAMLLLTAFTLIPTLSWSLVSEDHQTINPKIYDNSSVSNGGPNPMIVQQHSVTDERPYRVWGDSADGVPWASWLATLVDETRSVTETVPLYTLNQWETLWKKGHWENEIGHQRYSQSGPSPEVVRYRNTNINGDIVHYKG